jgi:hypothetical protein
VYRTVPGRSYLQTRVKRATPAKTAGDDTTGGSVCVSVQVSDESWIPDSRMTAGLRRGVGRREGDNLRRLPARALRFYRAHGIKVERLMTDNGSAYRSTVHAIACRTLKIKHIRTKPYRPRTNGKAERFIRTLLGGWAYGAIYRSSAERRPPCPAGSTSTIAADHTAPSATERPWSASRRSNRGTTSSVLTPRPPSGSKRRDDPNPGESARATRRSGPAEPAPGNRPTQLRVSAGPASPAMDRGRGDDALQLRVRDASVCARAPLAPRVGRKRSCRPALDRQSAPLTRLP